MSFWSDTQLIVKSMMPNLFHIIPISDNSMLNWVFQCQDTSFGLSFVSDISITLFHSNHYTRLTCTSNEGREHGTRGIISSETGFAHSRPIVNNEGSYILFIRHFELMA